MIRNESGDLQANLKLLMCGKVVSTNIVMYYHGQNYVHMTLLYTIFL